MAGAEQQPARSLKARAIQWLAQREHSRVELRRKLLPHAIAEMAAGEAGEGSKSAALRQLDALLDWLEAHQYLSQERFVESRVHARAARFGNLRIRQELAQHGAAISADIGASLKDSELARAQAVRRRKFSQSPSSPAEHAKQSRFLAGRGFSSDVIRQVLRDAAAERIDPDAADPDPD